jgi:hypothetical protein
MNSVFYANQQPADHGGVKAEHPFINFSDPSILQRLQNLQNDSELKENLDKQMKNPKFIKELQSNPATQHQVMQALTNPEIRQQLGPYLANANISGAIAQFLSGQQD